VIPLRVLHAVAPNAGPGNDGVEALVSWQVREGHAAALMVTSTARAPKINGVEVLPYGGGIVASLLGSRAEDTRRIAAWVPDLIHVHDLSLLPAALDLARRLSLQVVVGVTGAEDAATTRMLRDSRIAWVLIPTEGHRAHYLGKVGLSRDRVTLLPPGVDVEAAGTVPYRIGDDGATVVGLCGPCDERSEIERLAEALVNASRTAPIRGLYRPSSSEDAGRLADLLGDEAAQLIDIAPVGRDGFMARIDVFADASDGDRVSVPMLEAMACARPVLALASGSAPELVRDGRTAVLVPPSDRDGLATGLRLLTDAARRRELGEAGRALARERYDVKLVGAAMVELYRVAIGGTSSAAARSEGSTVYRRISETRVAR
jgi:glycosyltransferase involved in cell wall biosynthesis